MAPSDFNMNEEYYDFNICLIYIYIYIYIKENIIINTFKELGVSMVRPNSSFFDKTPIFYDAKYRPQIIKKIYKPYRITLFQ